MLETKEKAIVIIFISASMLLFFASVTWILIKRARNKCTPGKCTKTGISTALGFTGILILVIWALRFAVGYFRIIVPEPGIQTLSCTEELINSFFTTLRTFSLEEGYSEFIIDVKALVANVISPDNWLYSKCIFVMVGYASFVVILAPIMGGAVILNIFARAFPKFKLKLSYMNLMRPKIFFSELNDASLALAKSIVDLKKKEKPILIFTDVYVDVDKEQEHELLLEAQKYGAVCIRDDLSDIPKPKFGKRDYYLIDENENGNLQALTSLTKEDNIKYIKNSCIYMFVQSDSYVRIEEQVREKLKEKARPIIIPVNSYRNLVHNLMEDIPLYEPLINKADATSLNVTILGNGIIGTEAFLGTYWFGQIMVSQEKNGIKSMDECELTITVISNDSEEIFWSKIDYVNPEIKATVDVIGNSSALEQPNILFYNRNGLKNKPYCKVKYIQADVKIGAFWGHLVEDKQLYNSDYFIVALGNDADNISVAEKLHCTIGKKYVESATDDNIKNTVIAYSVFDSELAKILNEKKRYQLRDDNSTNIYMYAFGSLEQVYSCENIYMSRVSLLAEETNKAYINSQLEEIHIGDNKTRALDGENSNYKYWADMARAEHIKYKVFSLGWINHSVFSDCSDTIEIYGDETEHEEKKSSIISTDDYHRDLVHRICNKYKRIAISNTVGDNDKDEKQLKNDIELKKHCLAWLEHRRWNAFTRTMGYKYTDAENILDVKKSQKDMQLKLHSCLVEARLPALTETDTFIHADFKANGKVNLDTMFSEQNEKQSLDLLDEVSWARRKRDLQKKSNDFKVNDYYRYEFDDYLSLEEVSVLIKINKTRLVNLCQKGKFKGAVCFNKSDDWFIPFECIKPLLEKKYHKLDSSKPEDEILIRKIKKGEMSQGFEVFETWFVEKIDEV